MPLNTGTCICSASSIIGDKTLDERLYFRYTILRISLIEGRIPDAILAAERVRMPARGFANRSRAALGHRSAGTRTGPHGACLTQGSVAASRQNTAPSRLEETRFWG
jgi:hypothetical protein